jgi:hypothetical protein
MNDGVRPEEIPDDIAQPQIFNIGQRNDIEDAYEKFVGLAPETREDLISEEPIQLDSTPEPPPSTTDTGQIDTSGEAPVTPPSDTPAALKYKTHEEAERAYKEAERKMHEATQEAARYRKALEDRERILEMVKTQPPPQPPPQPSTPPFSREQIEAKFYEDPVGFVLGLVQNTSQKVRQETLSEFEQKLGMNLKEVEQRTVAADSQRYFDETYKDIKELEPFVDQEIRMVMTDRAFVESVSNQYRTIPERMRAVIDHAVGKVKERPIVKTLLEGKPQQTRERMPASPVTTPSSGSPVIAPKAPETETPEQYMESRRKMQDKITAGRRV